MNKKCFGGEDTPLYGWYDTMGNKFITIISTTNDKMMKMKMIKDYGSCVELCKRKSKNHAKLKPLDLSANSSLISFLDS